MTVDEIYRKYFIMPLLAEHQLRVAAVAETICENVTYEVDSESVRLACLFHDMGNIIKSDLTVFPEHNEPEGIAHWELVKKGFIEKYGVNEHKATLMIARDIGLPAQVIEYIDGIGFSKLEKTHSSDSYEQKICQYADLRVAPHGVLSLDGRMREAHERYLRRKDPETLAHADIFERYVAIAHDIERQIFANALVVPGDITENSVETKLAPLREKVIAL